MKFHNDQIYGSIELPQLIEELAETPEIQRLKGISQDVLPQSCVPYKVANRFDHCMGTYHLAQLALLRNNLEMPDARLLLASAFLHDAGNPALSHLSEPFLQKLTGKNGESFLGHRLYGKKAHRLLSKHWLQLYSVIDVVTGQHEPLSKIINGSMDVDNLDNVNRYWFAATDGDVAFDAECIASSFSFKTEWELFDSCLMEVRKWKDLRREVYSIIYSNPHLTAAMMVQRALAIAFSNGKITEDFFHMDDEQAIDFLLGCGKEAKSLILSTLKHTWYKEVFSAQTLQPTNGFKGAVSQWDFRSVFADQICKEFGLPKNAICVYIGQGRDEREITLPIVASDSSRTFLKESCAPVFRVKVYMDAEFSENKHNIVSLVNKMTESWF